MQFLVWIKDNKIIVVIVISAMLLTFGGGYMYAQYKAEQAERQLLMLNEGEDAIIEQGSVQDPPNSQEQLITEESAAGQQAENLSSGQLTEDSSGQAREIMVHVAGIVDKPGVYSLPKGSRIYDAIAAAGINKDSDLDSLNLAQQLSDGSKIVVGSITAREQAEQSGVDASGNDLVGGGYYDGTQSRDNAAESVNNDNNSSARININTADRAQLETLPGIGEVLAQRIIDYRENSGKFSSAEEIRNVSGIGDKRYEAIADLITVD